jgi:ParB family chromosome partitioning protein
LKIHELKTHPRPFSAIASGEKTFEWRRDDRGFEVGDMLLLKRFDPGVGRTTGSEIIRFVTYILRAPDFGVPEGYCVMSISPRRP